MTAKSRTLGLEATPLSARKSGLSGMAGRMVLFSVSVILPCCKACDSIGEVSWRASVIACQPEEEA